MDDAAKQPDAWRKVYPEPEEDIAKITHDADLISPFEAESVVPEDSKWRILAAQRWGAKGPVEEAHVVYYVFYRLFDEARSESGKSLALNEWRKIRPELIRLMGLEPDADSIKCSACRKHSSNGRGGRVSARPRVCRRDSRAGHN